MTRILALEGVTKQYASVTAVQDVSLGLEPGEAVALVGHNGAGKTTLMKLILGLIQPTAGTVRVFDGDPSSSQGAELRRHIGFLPENVAFHAAMTGIELLNFYARLKRQSKAANRAILGRVGLADAADRRVGTYSKGMRQRLGLAQAMLGAPRLLLLDEPTAGLDPASRQDFYASIDELRNGGTTVLITTHALAEIEQHVDRIAMMRGGRLIACGTAAELRHKAALPVLLRVRVHPCTTGQVLAKIGGIARVEMRDECSLLLACDPALKMALIRDIASLENCVEDIEIELPGLEMLYRRLVREEER